MLLTVLLSLSACSEYGYTDQWPPNDTPLDTGDEIPPDDIVEDDIATAEAPVYANTSTSLYNVDPETGVKYKMGDFHDGSSPVDGMVDIAIDLNGRMYGGTFDALYRIDPITAALFHVCDTDLRPYAMAFTSTGVLFAGAGTEIISIDLNTCEASNLTTTTSYETSGDLVGLPDGFLYWTVEGSGRDELVRVDPGSGTTTWVGAVNGEDLFGLGYDQDQLYGFSRWGEIVRISPSSAGSTVTVEDPGVSWWGATTNPVVWE